MIALTEVKWCIMHQEEDEEGELCSKAIRSLRRF